MIVAIRGKSVPSVNLPNGIKLVSVPRKRQNLRALYWYAAMSDKARVVHSDPEILSGTPVFVGTRVPVQSLFDYIEGGETLDEFLKQFPSVRREQAIAALELARESLLTRARTA